MIWVFAGGVLVGVLGMLLTLLAGMATLDAEHAARGEGWGE